jgi:hypothetical protein
MRFPAATFGVLLALMAGATLAREPIRPAEPPPAGYGGQQYVDSRGCMFVRAGTQGKVVWFPRVSVEGAPICGNPPSGHRLPVAEEIGTQPVPEAGAGGAAADATGAARADAGGYFVAVGSFAVTANADRAEAELSARNYAVVRGRVQGAESTLITVFAGPFADAATAVAAREALRGSGFPDATVIGP